MMGKQGFMYRMLAGLLAVLMFLPLGAAGAGEMVQNVRFFITLSWIDPLFQMQTVQALPVEIPGYEDCYWAMVPPGTPLDGLKMQIQDMEGKYQQFDPSNGAQLPPVQDAGEGIDLGEMPVQIMAKEADGQPGALIYLYVSTVSPSPVLPGDLPQTQGKLVDVAIHYMDEFGNSIASPTHKLLGAGVHTVYAAPENLPKEYELLMDAQQQITVEENGPDTLDVYFYYRYQQPAPQAVQVIIHYLDDKENPIADPSYKLLDMGTHTVYAEPGILPDHYTLMGDAAQLLTINETTPSQVEISFYYRYMPPATAAPVQGSIRVQLLEVSSNRELYAYDAPVTLGQTNDIYADLSMLPGEYAPVGDTWLQVYVDERGRANPAPAFYFISNATPAPTQAPQVQPAQVLVQYLSQDGLPVAQEEWIPCPYGQETVIQANPRNLMADYVLEGSGQAVVRVDEWGANPAQVTFLYRYSPNVPAPRIVMVPVKYLRPDGSIFYTTVETCVEGVDQVIRMDSSRVPAEYVQASPAEVRVTVDNQGVCTPAEVVFQFQDELIAHVTVYFQDPYGNPVASPQQVPCYEGNNSIFAQPLDLQAGYVLADESSKYVVLTQEGDLLPGSIVFTYVPVANVTPIPGTPSPFPYEYAAMDGYCLPKSDNVNFRSEPSTALKTSIIGQVNKKDMAQILGKARNYQNETWYHVRINGREGFLKETLVRVLSQAEIAAYFNYTPVPTLVPTISPSPAPDGTAIDRWALSNVGGLNFRRSPASGNNVITKINKNTRLWVYASQTVNGEKWYFVRVNGTDGYLLAKFVDLYSQQESNLIQQQLGSPMPTQSPLPTPSPTPLPTPIPTAVPTLMPTYPPTPAPSPTPSTYRGYATTRWMVGLSYGVGGMEEEGVIEVLPADSLVYVEWQAYVDGTAWSRVRSMASSAQGFVIHESLRPIGEMEAQWYLQAMAPAVTATPQPAQIYGYARTMGDGVPMRAYPDTNAEVLALLPDNAVLSVSGQLYEGGADWHMVQYDGQWGVIRQDQLFLMSPQEALEYEASLRNPAPIPSHSPTFAPTTQDSRTGHGHVQSNGRVNLRSQPTTQSTSLKLLYNYAYATVLNAVEGENGTWYHVIQNGTEGYISGKYFKVLTQGELIQFLQSPEYLNCDSNNVQSNVGNSIIQLRPLEDYNQQVWKNPALDVTYEPFNPYITATPRPEWQPTQSPAPQPTQTPSSTVPPVGPFGVYNPPSGSTQTQEGGSPWPLVLLGIAGAGVGAAAYAYSIHKKNERRRRQAMRAQQARQARAAQPQMQAARNNPHQGTRNYAPVGGAGYPPSAYDPPRQAINRQSSHQEGRKAQGGMAQGTQAYRPAQPQQTGTYRPAQPQQTGTYRPAQPQQTGTYRPVQPRQTAGNQPAAGQRSPQQPGQYAPRPAPGTASTDPQHYARPQAGRQPTQTFRPVNSQAPVQPQPQRRAGRYPGDAANGDA